MRGSPRRETILRPELSHFESRIMDILSSTLLRFWVRLRPHEMMRPHENCISFFVEMKFVLQNSMLNCNRPNPLQNFVIARKKIGPTDLWHNHRNFQIHTKDQPGAVGTTQIRNLQAVLVRRHVRIFNCLSIITVWFTTDRFQHIIGLASDVFYLV